jgi:hypothetical protein
MIYIENRQRGPKYQKISQDNFVVYTRKGSRGLNTEAGLKSLSGGADRPHPSTGGPPVVGSHHELLEYSSTTSKDASQPYVKSV